jgi:hypothetical protein
VVVFEQVPVANVGNPPIATGLASSNESKEKSLKVDKSKVGNMLVNISAVIILVGTIYSAVRFIIIPVSKFLWAASVNAVTDGYQQSIIFVENNMDTFMRWDVAFYLLLGLTLYLLPTIIAIQRKHHNRRSICFTNVFFGWSFIGWVLALIWGLSSPKAPPAQQRYGAN